MPLDATREVLYNKTGDDLLRLNVAPTHSLFRELAASKSVATADAVAMLEPSKISELLRLNILAVHPNGTYSLNSRHVEAYVKKELAEELDAGGGAAEARRWW